MISYQIQDSFIFKTSPMKMRNNGSNNVTINSKVLKGDPIPLEPRNKRMYIQIEKHIPKIIPKITNMFIHITAIFVFDNDCFTIIIILKLGEFLNTKIKTAQRWAVLRLKKISLIFGNEGRNWIVYFLFLSLPSRYLFNASFEENQILPSLWASSFPVLAKRFKYLAENLVPLLNWLNDINFSFSFSFGVNIFK